MEKSTKKRIELVDEAIKELLAWKEDVTLFERESPRSNKNIEAAYRKTKEVRDNTEDYYYD